MVRGLRGKGARLDAWDALAAGLVLRIGKSGSCTWSLWYRTRAGGKRRFTIGPYRQFGAPGDGTSLTISEARARATELPEAIRAGSDPAGEPAAAPAAAPAQLTLAALAREALDALRPPRVATSTHEEWARLARVELEPWRGQDPAAAITRREAREFLRGIVERGSPSTANHVLDAARRFYSWGVAEELVEANPWAGLESPAPRPQSDRVLSVEEARAVWRALDVLAGERRFERKGRKGKVAMWTAPGRPQACDVVRLLLLTGVRLDAALGLQRREVEGLAGDAPVWTVPAERVKAKRGQRRPHVVPLSPAAADVVRRRLEGGGEYGFPVLPKPGRRAEGPMVWVSHFVKLLREEADRQLGRPMEPWTIHKFRHTVATNARELLGTRDDVIGLLLGHVRDGRTATKVYLRAELLEERRAALTAWAGLVGGAA
jgi:integrase